MWHIDGNEYIDYVGSWGLEIIGHADDEVLKALADNNEKGNQLWCSMSSRERTG